MADYDYGFYDNSITGEVFNAGTVTITYSTVDPDAPIIYIGANGCGGGACEHWPTWVTEATTGVTQTTWTNWNNNVTVAYHPPVEVYQPTPAQLEEIRVAEARVREQYQERDRQAKAADTRARELLHSLLTKAQRESLEKRKHFEVVGQSGARYRIREGSHGNVRLLDNGGREVAKYCGQPDGVPVADMMLAQKLQLEADEDEFLRRANRTAA